MTIKVAFVDFPGGINQEHNFIMKILTNKYKVKIDLQNPDFLFYATHGTDHFNYSSCVKIFYSNEAVTPNFSECDYAISYDRLSFGNRYIRHDRTAIRQPIGSISDVINRKFCNYVYSNTTTGEGCYYREMFCRELMKYKHIDCPGKSLHNVNNILAPRYSSDPFGSKLKFLKNYKFTISFENCRKSGYVTEKMIHPLIANSIPIYWGAPDVDLDFNEKAFINVSRYKSFKELIEFIIFLDNNTDEYLSVLQQPPMQANYIQDVDKLEKFILGIIDYGVKPINKTPHLFHDSEKVLINSLSHELVEFYISNGFLTKAIEKCQLSIKLDRSIVWPYRKLEKIYNMNKTNEYHNALISFVEKFINDNEMNVKIFNLAYYILDCLIRLQDYNTASRLCNFIINRGIFDFRPYDIMAHILYKTTKLDDALVYNQESIKLSNNDPKLIHFRACIYEKKGDIENAEKFSKLCLKQLKHPEFYFTLSRIYKHLNNLKESILSCEEAINLSDSLSPRIKTFKLFLNKLKCLN